MKPFQITLAAMILSTSATTLAEPAGPGKRMFDKIDINGDGFVSFEEFQLPRQGKGPKADLDGNGNLTREEVRQHVAKESAEMSERAGDRFDRMDSNDDGVVTALEAKEAAFYRMDKDQDGFLSAEELKRPHKRPHGGKHDD